MDVINHEEGGVAVTADKNENYKPIIMTSSKEVGIIHYHFTSSAFSPQAYLGIFYSVCFVVDQEIPEKLPCPLFCRTAKPPSWSEVTKIIVSVRFWAQSIALSTAFENSTVSRTLRAMSLACPAWSILPP